MHIQQAQTQRKTLRTCLTQMISLQTDLLRHQNRLLYRCSQIIDANSNAPPQTPGMGQPARVSPIESQEPNTNQPANARERQTATQLQTHRFLRRMQTVSREIVKFKQSQESMDSAVLNGQHYDEARYDQMLQSLQVVSEFVESTKQAPKQPDSDTAPQTQPKCADGQEQAGTESTVNWKTGQGREFEPLDKPGKDQSSPESNTSKEATRDAAGGDKQGGKTDWSLLAAPAGEAPSKDISKQNWYFKSTKNKKNLQIFLNLFDQSNSKNSIPWCPLNRKKDSWFIGHPIKSIYSKAFSKKSGFFSNLIQSIQAKIGNRPSKVYNL